MAREVHRNDVEKPDDQQRKVDNLIAATEFLLENVAYTSDVNTCECGGKNFLGGICEHIQARRAIAAMKSG